MWRRTAGRRGGAGTGSMGRRWVVSPKKITILLTLQTIVENPPGRVFGSTKKGNPLQIDGKAKPAVDPHCIRWTTAALRSWLLTSVPTPICVCKPFSCKASLGTIQTIVENTPGRIYGSTNKQNFCKTMEEQNQRLKTGLSAGRRPLFVLGCRPMYRSPFVSVRARNLYRSLFVSVWPICSSLFVSFHARHVREEDQGGEAGKGEGRQGEASIVPVRRKTKPHIRNRSSL